MPGEGKEVKISSLSKALQMIYYTTGSLVQQTLSHGVYKYIAYASLKSFNINAASKVVLILKHFSSGTHYLEQQSVWIHHK